MCTRCPILVINPCSNTVCFALIQSFKVDGSEASSIYLSIYLSICLSIYLSIYLLVVVACTLFDFDGYEYQLQHGKEASNVKCLCCNLLKVYLTSSLCTSRLPSVCLPRSCTFMFSQTCTNIKSEMCERGNQAFLCCWENVCFALLHASQ